MVADNVTPKVCGVDGCERSAKARGWCFAHYQRFKKYGDPLTMSPIYAAAGLGVRASVTKKPGRPPSGNTRTHNGYVVTGGNAKGEHIVVAERALGKQLPSKAEVHHVDGVRSNNANDNLVICPDHAYHMLLHVRQRALESCGNADWRKCTFCKTYDDTDNLCVRNGSRYYHRMCNTEASALRRSRAKLVSTS